MSSSIRPPGGRRQPVGGRSRPISMIEPNAFTLPTPSSDDATSKASKRRSLLPQLSQFSRNSSVDERGNQDETIDVVTLSSQSRLGTNEEEAAIEERRQLVGSPSRMRRGLSIRRPTNGELVEADPKHARARSNSKELGNAHVRSELANGDRSNPGNAASRSTIPDSGLKRTSSIRPPQSSSTSSGLSRTGSVRAPQSHIRTGSIVSNVGATSGVKRGSVSSTRPSPMNNPVQGQSQSIASPTKASERHNPGGSMLPPPRPAFNTYQQHYSPSKSSLPKPPVPNIKSSKATGSGEEEVAVSIDVTRQQIEVMQLSMLHQASLQASADYDASARRKLAKVHSRLRKEMEGIIEVEQELGKLANLRALQAWCPDPSYLAESLQTLSRIYGEVSGMAERDSRYAEMVRVFERWVQEAEDCLAGVKAGFVDALPETWRHSHASMALRLRSSQRDMASLPRAQKPSSLALMIESCESLLDDMLRELDSLTKLEEEILKRDKRRIDTAVASLPSARSDHDSMGSWVPVWQKVT